MADKLTQPIPMKETLNRYLQQIPWFLLFPSSKWRFELPTQMLQEHHPDCNLALGIKHNTLLRFFLPKNFFARSKKTIEY